MLENASPTNLMMIESRCLDCMASEAPGLTPRKSPRKRVRQSSGELPLTSEPADSFSSARGDRLSVRHARSVSIGVCRSLEFVALSSASQGMMQRCADGKVAGPPPLASAALGDAEAKLPRIGHNSTRVEMREPSFRPPTRRGASVCSVKSSTCSMLFGSQASSAFTSLASFTTLLAGGKNGVLDTPPGAPDGRLSNCSMHLGSQASSSFASLGSFTTLLAGGTNGALDTPPGAPGAFEKSAALMRAPLRMSSVARPSRLGAPSDSAAPVTRL